MIVVDASAILDLLLRTPSGASTPSLMFAPGQTLHAPHLLDIEIAQVIRRYEAKGEIDDARGREALSDLADLPIQRYPHDLFLPRVWELRRNLTAYDAVYVALAEGLDAPLLTSDRRLADAVLPVFPGHVDVRVVKRKARNGKETKIPWDLCFASIPMDFIDSPQRREGLTPGHGGKSMNVFGGRRQ